MAEETIQATVGAGGANRPDDVKTVQRLLAKVTPPLTNRPAETGTADSKTLAAIHEFQLRFTSNPDSRVDPDGRTLWHLNDGFVSQYIHCKESQKRTIDADIVAAQKWLDVVNRRLSAMNADAKRVVKNVFHLDADKTNDGPLLLALKLSFWTLRTSFDKSFPFECLTTTSLYGAWVVLSDPTGTMHLPANHFTASAKERQERIIHERAHTVFQISHAGMSGGGAVDMGASQDDDNGFTYQQAVANAYCYGWLAAALQPDYVPSGGGEVITVGH
jgi:hypothetical protein